MRFGDVVVPPAEPVRPHQPRQTPRTHPLEDGREDRHGVLKGLEELDLVRVAALDLGHQHVGGLSTRAEAHVALAPEQRLVAPRLLGHAAAVHAPVLAQGRGPGGGGDNTIVSVTGCLSFGPHVPQLASFPQKLTGGGGKIIERHYLDIPTSRPPKLNNPACPSGPCTHTCSPGASPPAPPCSGHGPGGPRPPREGRLRRPGALPAASSRSEALCRVGVGVGSVRQKRDRGVAACWLLPLASADDERRTTARVVGVFNPTGLDIKCTMWCVL